MNPKIAAALACLALQACAATGGSTPAPAPAPAPARVAAPAEGFVPMAELRALTGAKPWECLNYDEASRTCEAVGRRTWRDDRGGTARLAVLVDDRPRTTAVMSVPIWAEGDLECRRLAEASVEVAGGAALPDRAADGLAAAMRGELAKDRTVTCSGVVRDGEHFRVVGYRDGRRSATGKGSAMRLFAEPPALRLADQDI